MMPTGCGVFGHFKIPLDGGSPVRLASGSALNPVWSPDGSLIVYAGYKRAHLRSASGRAPGRNQRQIARDYLAALGRARPLLA
jgi:Tol biopolymer transport system component